MLIFTLFAKMSGTRGDGNRRKEYAMPLPLETPEQAMYIKDGTLLGIISFLYNSSATSYIQYCSNPS
jgi:hypothetical protein